MGVNENFVKVNNKHGKGFEYLREIFSELSDAELKEVIFIGPQIRVIINGDLSEHLFTQN